MARPVGNASHSRSRPAEDAEAAEKAAAGGDRDGAQAAEEPSGGTASQVADDARSAVRPFAGNSQGSGWDLQVRGWVAARGGTRFVASVPCSLPSLTPARPPVATRSRASTPLRVASVGDGAGVSPLAGAPPQPLARFDFARLAPSRPVPAGLHRRDAQVLSAWERCCELAVSLLHICFLSPVAPPSSTTIPTPALPPLSSATAPPTIAATADQRSLPRDTCVLPPIAPIPLVVTAAQTQASLQPTREEALPSLADGRAQSAGRRAGSAILPSRATRAATPPSAPEITVQPLPQPPSPPLDAAVARETLLEVPTQARRVAAGSGTSLIGEWGDAGEVTTRRDRDGTLLLPATPTALPSVGSSSDALRLSAVASGAPASPAPSPSASQVMIPVSTAPPQPLPATMSPLHPARSSRQLPTAARPSSGPPRFTSPGGRPPLARRSPPRSPEPSAFRGGPSDSTRPQSAAAALALALAAQAGPEALARTSVGGALAAARDSLIITGLHRPRRASPGEVARAPADTGEQALGEIEAPVVEPSALAVQIDKPMPPATSPPQPLSHHKPPSPPPPPPPGSRSQTPPEAGMLDVSGSAPSSPPPVADLGAQLAPLGGVAVIIEDFVPADAESTTGEAAASRDGDEQMHAATAWSRSICPGTRSRSPHTLSHPSAQANHAPNRGRPPAMPCRAAANISSQSLPQGAHCCTAAC